jgi:hypothetical protein
MASPERRAYREAWNARQQTGDESHELLLHRLRANGADPVWSEPGGELHEWLLDCWDRGVSPRAIGVEAAKLVAGTIPRLVAPLREVLRYLR